MARFTSVLFPGGETPKAPVEAPDCFHDLHLDEIVAAVTAGQNDDHVKWFFHCPLADVSTVEYRHEIFRDLGLDEIRRLISTFDDGMQTMQDRLHQAKRLGHRQQRQGWFIDAVQTFCSTVASLRSRLARVEPSSQGLRGFADYVTEFVDGHTFQTLMADTKAVQAELQTVRYTVHIQGMRVRVEKYAGQADYGEATVRTFGRFAGQASKDYHVPLKDDTDMTQVEAQILTCVAELYPKTFALLDEFCRRNDRFVDRTIARFADEIRFYLSYLAFIGRFADDGLTFSYPEITDEPGTLSADDVFDLALMIKTPDSAQSIVRNGFQLSGPEQILVVTGPNQGGKTTFARTVGQCAYLASLGCPIPARQAKFTLPDHIYTHFERQESLSTLHGKLHDELVRVHEILSRATATSIIVMNESFSSTTVNDAVVIGTEIIQRIIKLNCVAVYVTFLDELASVDPACVSLVGEVAAHDPAQRTFKFSRRPADGLAYAAALAKKYELDHDKLSRRIGR